MLGRGEAAARHGHERTTGNDDGGGNVESEIFCALDGHRGDQQDSATVASRHALRRVAWFATSIVSTGGYAK